MEIIVTPPYQYAMGLLADETQAIFRYSPHAISDYAEVWNIRVEIDFLAGATDAFRYKLANK